MIEATKVKIKINGEHWSSGQGNGVFVRGAAYKDGFLYKGQKLIEIFRGLDSFHDFVRIVKKLNGFFYVIVKKNDELYIAVDHVRSIPLFYAIHEGAFLISDDAEWIRSQIGQNRMRDISCCEFQVVGYVTGKDTLFPSIKQVQAGEALEIKRERESWSISSYRYYRFLHDEPNSYNEDELVNLLERVALESIQRLVEYAGNRQIVVPLSGGYDSRLIVTLLKKLGYKDVLTFSYGNIKHHESVISKKVAESLGYKWFFVEYTREKWREAWKTPERWEYQQWSSGWTSLPHIQDWLAVMELKKQGVIDDNCLFVPGHSGDFVAGSHIPEEAFSGVDVNHKVLAQTILKKHYCLVPQKFLENFGLDFWIQRILMVAEAGEISSGVDLANYFEKWDWQERQAKFIINSVRVYEFFGYDWWLPLWDLEFVKFWHFVPLALRKERWWYVKFVKTIYSRLLGIGVDKALGHSSDRILPISILKGFIKGINHTIYEYISPLVEFLRDYFHFRRIVLDDQIEFLKLAVRGFRVNGIFAYLFLRDYQLYLPSCCR